MKKIVLLVASIMAMAAVAQSAGIKNSAHDLSGGGLLNGGASTEICVYCHTPHNPTQNIPLWNRNNPGASSWTFYNSPTLSAAARGAQFGADSNSLFCMSCHDGVTKMGAIKNRPAGVAGQEVLAVATGAPLISTSYAAIGQGGPNNDGKSLANDHPVGFSYEEARLQDNAQGTGGLNEMTSVNGSFNVGPGSTVFFNGNSKQNTMECASCHKVHEPGLAKNFLRIDNDKSALCLACHNK